MDEKAKRPDPGSG